MSSDFTPEQKRYLEGFVSGIQARGGTVFPAPGNAPQAVPEPKPMGPDAPHLIAQDETIKAGKKLADQEKWKREEHPFDAYQKLRGQAGRDEYPKAADNFRWRYYDLFYVAPAEDSYMCRLRIPNGILRRRRLWRQERDRPRDFARRESAGRASAGRRFAQGVSCPSRQRRGKFPGFFGAP